jgi:DNA-binding MarR family transcriptional regulator
MPVKSGTSRERAPSTGRSARAKPNAAAQEAWDLIVSFVFSDLVHDRMHVACEAVDLSPGLAKALLSLEPGVARPMGELAGNWRCDASYATSVVDGLESRGLVERKIFPTDRRVRTVVLTPAGERAKETWMLALSEPPPGFGDLGGTDARALRNLLRRVLTGALRRAADRLDEQLDNLDGH